MVRRVRPTRVLAFATCALAVASAGGTARAAAVAPGVCSVLGKADVARINGWQVANVEKRVYTSHGATGRMCTLDSAQGQIVVVMPDLGAPFPGEALAGGTEFERHFSAGGQDVKLSNGTGYFAIGRQGVAIRIVPNDHPASYAEVEPFVRTAIARVARRAH